MFDEFCDTLMETVFKKTSQRYEQIRGPAASSADTNQSPPRTLRSRSSVLLGGFYTDTTGVEF